jgi:transcriptional regulator with XRE-family HTH domain
MENEKKFSDAFKTFRIKKGWTQEEMAKRLGMSRSVISFLENGQQYPKFNHLLMIKERLGLDLSEMISGTPTPDQVSERPYFGPPNDMPNDMHQLMILYNNQKEVRKDLSIATKMLEELDDEMKNITFNGQKLIKRVKDILVQCQLML